jgi:hypothetical protein
MASASSRNAKLVRLRLATLSYSHTFTVGLVWLGFGLVGLVVTAMRRCRLSPVSCSRCLTPWMMGALDDGSE